MKTKTTDLTARLSALAMVIHLEKEMPHPSRAVIAQRTAEYRRTAEAFMAETLRARWIKLGSLKIPDLPSLESEGTK